MIAASLDLRFAQISLIKFVLKCVLLPCVQEPYDPYSDPRYNRGGGSGGRRQQEADGGYPNYQGGRNNY
jgi:hypothetical protein